MTQINESTNQIFTTRGDNLDLDLKILTDEGEYQFEKGDTIRFSIYKASKLNEGAILIKDFKVAESSNTFHIHIPGEEMKIGELKNVPNDYWYEIILNNNLTVIGYKVGGPSILTLLPEGSDVQKNSGGEK